MALFPLDFSERFEVERGKNAEAHQGSRKHHRLPLEAGSEATLVSPPRPKPGPTRDPSPRQPRPGGDPSVWVFGCCRRASLRGGRQPAPCKTTSTTRRSSRRARTAAAPRSTTTPGGAAASGLCSSASTSSASLWVSPDPRVPRPLRARLASQPAGVPARGAPRFLAGAQPPASRVSRQRRAVSPGGPRSLPGESSRPSCPPGPRPPCSHRLPGLHTSVGGVLRGSRATGNCSLKRSKPLGRPGGIPREGVGSPV